MSDENTMDDVIEQSQEDMNDFTSFEDADNSIEEVKASEDDSEEEESFPDESDLDDEEEVKVEEKEEKKELKLDSKEEIKEEGKEEAKESKMITAQSGDKSIDISAEALIKHTVDGKEVEKTLQEWLNDASGQDTVSQRFTALDQDKKAFSSEKAQFVAESGDLNNKVDAFVVAVNNQDGVGAVDALAKLSGSNPVELRQHFKNLMVDQVRAYIEMSPEQQKDFDIQQEREYYQKTEEYRNQELETQQDSINLERELTTFQLKYGISNEALVEMYDKAGENSEEEITPETLERYHQGQLTHDKASNLMSQAAPSVNDADSLKVLQGYIDENPDLTDEEIIEDIKAALATETTQETKKTSVKDKVAKRVKKSNPNNFEKDVDFSQAEDDDDLLTFDDLGY